MNDSGASLNGLESLKEEMRHIADKQCQSDRFIVSLLDAMKDDAIKEIRKGMGCISHETHYTELDNQKTEYEILLREYVKAKLRVRRISKKMVRLSWNTDNIYHTQEQEYWESKMNFYHQKAMESLGEL